MIDTHAHLTDSRYDGYRTDMISSFSKDNIDIVLSVACEMEQIPKTLALAEQYDNIYAIIGIHPENLGELDEKGFDYLRQKLTHPKVVALGEIGLDYNFCNNNKEEQKETFVKQLQLAHQMHLPVVIHCRDAIGDMLEILRENKHLLTDGGVMHCFNQSIESFREIKKLGLKVSLGGVVTFKNAKNTASLIEQIDLSDIMLETDCPYLTPEPFRGKVTNEPKYVRYVAEKIAEIKNISVEEVVKKTTENVYRTFPKVRQIG